MKRPEILVTLAAIIYLGVRAAADFAGPWWPLNPLHYLSAPVTAILTLLGILLAIPAVSSKIMAPKWDANPPTVPAWAVALIALAAALVLPKISTPLLGDGLDRIEALNAGFAGMEGQPSPLDLALHLLLYKLYDFGGRNDWESAWWMWRWTSIMAAAPAAAFSWKLARLRGRSRGETWFIFISVMFSGAGIFFLGYVENYVFLAAAVLGYLVAVELAGRGRLKPWVLILLIAVLVGLHYFMALLLPVTLFMLIRHKIMRPKPARLAVVSILFLGFMAMALWMVREYYRGVGAIFVQPENLFGAYHLWGFFGAQLLACPALPLLLPLALSRRLKAPDPLLDFAGASGAALLVFFFFLRPVIGPPFDWDLFALPALFYTPWLAIRAADTLRDRPGFPAMARAAMAVSVFTFLPWYALNTGEVQSIARFRDLLEWEAVHNRWSASYGYIRLGKYLGRRPWERTNPEIERSFEKAVEINPDSATVRLQVAQALKARGREDMAREQFAHHYRLAGRYHEGQGQFDKAADSYRAALALEPGMKEAAQALIRLYETELNDPARAEAARKNLGLIEEKAGP